MKFLVAIAMAMIRVNAQSLIRVDVAASILFLFCLCSCSKGPVEYLSVPDTYCNPVNLDYAFVPSAHKYYAKDQSHRSTADPAMVKLRDTLYLFSTNQNGYWWS